MNKKEMDIIIKGTITQESLAFLKTEAQKQGTVCNNIDEVIVKGIPVKEFLMLYKNYLDSQKRKSDIKPYLKQIEQINVWEKEAHPETFDDLIKVLTETIDTVERKIEILFLVLDVLKTIQRKND